MEDTSTPTTNVRSGSSKRLHSEAEDGDNEIVAPTETPQEGVENQRGEKVQREGLKKRATTTSLM